MTANTYLTDPYGKWCYSSTCDLLPYNKPAVYCIYIDNELIYIGQTRNLYKRLFQEHWSKAHVDRTDYPFRVTFSFGTFAFSNGISFKYKYEKKYGESPMTEIRLLKKIKTRGNKEFYDN